MFQDNLKTTAYKYLCYHHVSSLKTDGEILLLEALLLQSLDFIHNKASNNERRYVSTHILA